MDEYFYFKNFVEKDIINKIIEHYDEKKLYKFTPGDSSRQQYQEYNKELIEIIKNIFYKVSIKMNLKKEINFDENYLHFRKYGIGDYFDWHRDYGVVNRSPDLIYEFVLTLFNTSDSYTEFKIPHERSESPERSCSLPEVVNDHRESPVTYRIERREPRDPDAQSTTGAINPESNVKRYSTQAGDILILCRHGIEHRVTRVNEGERLTIKFKSI